MGSSNYQGEICIDGVSIKNIESESLYQLMTSVQQNVFVFNDTIRNNVTMFHEFPDREVTLALERSGLSEFIEKRGEDFVCGENGFSEPNLAVMFAQGRPYMPPKKLSDKVSDFLGKV